MYGDGDCIVLQLNSFNSKSYHKEQPSESHQSNQWKNNLCQWMTTEYTLRNKLLLQRQTCSHVLI